MAFKITWTCSPLTAAAGMPNVKDDLRRSRNVHIDGLNNLSHWTQGTPSNRQVEEHYNESEPTAIRIGDWKSHFKIRDGFFDSLKPSALVFNLRMDPFERHDGQKNNDIAIRLGIAWGGPGAGCPSRAPANPPAIPAPPSRGHPHSPAGSTLNIGD